MKMIEIVRELQAKGHTVDFYVRRDGGILIKRIDGETFHTGASGNARARQLLGETLSEARAKQLKYATKTRTRKRTTLPSEVRLEYERVKKIWNKTFKAKGGKGHTAGYFGKGRIEYAFQHYGKEEALRRISEAERYASGYAYSKNVTILAEFIRTAGERYQSQALIRLPPFLGRRKETAVKPPKKRFPTPALLPQLLSP